MNSIHIARFVNEITPYAILGCGIAGVTHIFNPAGGALFGAVTLLSGKVLAVGCDGFFGNAPAEKTLKIGAECFGGFFVALGVMVQIGYKITFASSLILAVLMLPLALIVTQVALPIFYACLQ